MKIDFFASESKRVQSYKNHLQISFTDKMEAQRKSEKDVWNIRTGCCERPSFEFRNEAMVAAHQIAAVAGAHKILMLYMDGSFQSQFMVQAFLWSNVKFKVMIPRFKNDLNIFSMSQSVMLLENLQLPYELYEIDLESILNSSETKTAVSEFSSDQVQQLVAMAVWKEKQNKNEFMIFPFGLAQFSLTDEGWKVIESEKDYGLYLYQKQKQLDGVSAFFKWSPELMHSFLNDPKLKLIMMNSRKEVVISDHIYKEIFENYFKIWGDKNLTGFEKSGRLIKNFYDQIQQMRCFSVMAYAFTYADYCARIDYKYERNSHLRMAP